MLATRLVLASPIVVGGASCTAKVTAQECVIETTHSLLKIRVFKSGLFSAFGHNHEIEAPIADGTVHLSADPSVSLQVHARELHVLDPDVSAKERADVQRTMEGPEVLDIKRFPEISFRSTAVQKKNERQWVVRGNLTLHGQTSPVEVEVAYKDDRYQGSSQIRQRDFGMTPVAVAGGTVRVKDELKVEFEIVLK
jgi:polyisoprenoid-binding protein YceI